MSEMADSEEEPSSWYYLGILVVALFFTLLIGPFGLLIGLILFVMLGVGQQTTDVTELKDTVAKLEKQIEELQQKDQDK